MNEIIWGEWRKHLLAKGWTEDFEGNLTRPNLMGSLDLIKPKPDALPALDQKPVARKSRSRKLAICVTIISMRKRLLDSDNLTASFKPFRDAIAKSLGVDDGDKRFRWEYEQIETRGECGTIVRISLK